MVFVFRLFLIAISSLAVISCCTVKTNFSDKFTDRGPMLTATQQSFVTITSNVVQRLCVPGTSGKEPFCLPAIKGKRAASGVIIAHDKKRNTSLVLTVAHVCRFKAKQFLRMGWIERTEDAKMVSTVDNKNYKYNVLLPLDNKLDICVIETARIDKPPISITWAELKYGQRVYSISNAGGLAKGKVVPVETGLFYGTIDGLNYYTIFSSPGSSGGPIVNSSGQLVGLISHIYRNARNVTVGPSNKSIMEFLKIVLKERRSLILSI